MSFGHARAAYDKALRLREYKRRIRVRAELRLCAMPVIVEPVKQPIERPGIVQADGVDYVIVWDGNVHE